MEPVLCNSPLPLQKWTSGVCIKGTIAFRGATWRREVIVSGALQSRQQEDVARMKLETIIPKNACQSKACNCLFGYLDSVLYSE